MGEECNKDSYKESLKATSLFGGVQIFNIFIGIVRSKFVAILLGPNGMGIVGLLSSTIGLINSLTNFGLGTSAVRDIASANSTGETRKIALVIQVFRRLVWITGLMGLFVCIFLSPYLSYITFGNYNYTIAFIILSSTILFTQLTTGQTALLQGMRKYAFLAKANVLGNSLGLIVTIPLYYLLKIDAIVPVLIVTSFFSLALSLYYSKKTGIEKIHITFNDVRTEGKGMLKMGFFISLQGILSVAASYLIRIFISNYGGLSDVGLFTAGFSIVNTYVGLIFTAMGTDYYPRLSAESVSDKIIFNKVVNQQIEISLLLLAPIITIFIIFIRLVVTILFSSKFLPIEGMIYWAIFGVFFKAVSWSIAFSFLAKGDTKAFFWNELAAILYSTMFNVLGYLYWKLTGLGVSFLVGYIVYLIQVWIVSGKRYEVYIQKGIFKIFIIQFFLSFVCILLVLFTQLVVRYVLGTILVILSFYYSYIELDKRIEFSRYIKKNNRE
ncbi:O-antigen translocase [uncultured Bacteroides sp.]|uniref:O-antigen translocase n=1 Tax=uncultured Bacteroides sp. TaxID=162156 RepID=UPI002AAB85CF|nr:O-antigen translocase [uncultured Bacteroides sp.]